MVNEELHLGYAEPLPTRPDRWHPKVGDIIWFVLTREEADDVYCLYGERVSRVLIEITKTRNSGCIIYGNTLHEPVWALAGNLSRCCPAPPLVALAAQA